MLNLKNGTDFTISSHNAYLNSEIIISSILDYDKHKDLPEWSHCIKDISTNKLYEIKDTPIRTFLTAGHHRFVSCNTEKKQCIDVFIHDAMKFGGSKLKQGFIYDDNPWIFVEMNDRLYIYNRETKSETVEFNLSPDEIKPLDENHFLFKTHGDYCVYSLLEWQPIYSFTSYLWANSHLVISKDSNNKLLVFDYKKNQSVIDVEICQYALDEEYNILYFSRNNANHICALDLCTNDVNVIYENFNLNESFNYALKGHYLFFCKIQNAESFEYELVDLKKGRSENFILPYNVQNFLGHSLHEYSALKEIFTNTYTKYAQECRRRSVDLIYILFDVIDVEFINNQYVLIIKQKITAKCATIGDSETYLKYEVNSRKLYGIDYLENNIKPVQELNSQIKEVHHNLIPNAISSNGCYLAIKNGEILLYDKDGIHNEVILSNIYNNKEFSDAYFTSDGNNIVIPYLADKALVCPLNSLESYTFDIAGLSMAKNMGYNGYKPFIDLPIGSSRKPVWRDPVTLQHIDEKELSQYIFMSPKKDYCANNNYQSIRHNILTDEDISYDEFRKLCDKYNWNAETNTNEKEHKKKLRNQLLLHFGRERLFEKIITYADRLFNCIEEKNRKLDYINNEVYKYLNEKPNFTDLFIDRLDYVCFRKTSDGIENKILIGRNVRYLNYVSFSYDSRYIAVGAKMDKDTWRNTEEGVFLLYDIEKECNIKRIDTQSDLYAVWVTMFSRTGKIAFYDSRPTSYLLTLDDNCNDLKIVPNRNLLCFSASGNYIAFSNQQYIKYSEDKLIWGHQPSHNVYICKTDNVNTILCTLNVGDVITGLDKGNRYAKNVVSAAFSFNDKHLMVVCSDGTIVVWNIDSYIVEDGCLVCSQLGDMTLPKIREYDRVGKTFVSKYFEGENIAKEVEVEYHCALDEQLDAEQSLVYSSDGKVLKKCLNIKNEFYSIPIGVERIEGKVFSGISNPNYIEHNHLKRISLPDTIRYISEEAFSECPMLQEIIIGDINCKIPSIYSRYVKYIGMPGF